LAAAGAGLVASTTAGRTGQNAFHPSPYGWPIAPFDREHAIRGVFGDPRTIFEGPPTVQTLLHGAGRFSFHFGVDIPTRNGEAVFAVLSGVVVEATKAQVGISDGRGRVIHYWHLDFLVKKGDRVLAERTVIGRATHHGHMHLAEYDDGRAVNPLQEGHLTPYTDTVKPRVLSISFRGPDGVEPLLPNFIRGSVVIVVAADDATSDGVTGEWHGAPVVPALVRWRIEQWNGKVVVPERTAVDFRRTEPGSDRFWDIYARGTFQNASAFGNHYSWAQPGVYLFKLTAAPLETAKLLHDGVYDVVVTAVDIRGNAASLAQRFTVHNRSGWR
jgi:hypothetical protein